jgi:hypothetical protein
MLQLLNPSTKPQKRATTLAALLQMNDGKFERILSLVSPAFASCVTGLFSF